MANRSFISTNSVRTMPISRALRLCPQAMCVPVPHRACSTKSREIRAVLDRFAALDPRLGIYKTRLDEAYDKVLAGEHDWVSGARIDSYHTVWFELHEDLLTSLGRDRSQEAPH